MSYSITDVTELITDNSRYRLLLNWLSLTKNTFQIEDLNIKNKIIKILDGNMAEYL